MGGQGAAPGRGNSFLDVFAGAVEVWDEGNVTAEVVAGGVLGVGENAVAVVTPQVDALVPGHLCGVSHEAHGELLVPLVAAALLALTDRRDDTVGHAAVARAGCGEAQGVFEEDALLAEHADGENGLNGRQVPVAVGVEHVSGDRRIPDVQKRLLASRDVRVRPAVIPGVPQQFGRVDELEGLQAGTERPVGSRDDPQRGGPCVEDVTSLVGMGAVACDGPQQRVLVGRGRVGDGLVHEVGGTTAPGGDLACVLDAVRGLRTAVCGKGDKTVVNGRLSTGDRGPHTGEIGRAVQQPGVGEDGSVSVVVRSRRPRRRRV